MSSKQTKQAPINVPSFAPVLNRITKAVGHSEAKVDAIREKATETIVGVMEQYRVALINADVPKTLAGSKAIRARINAAKKESVAFLNLVNSGLYKEATLSHYTTGLILSYMHGVEFRPNHANSVKDGGLARPEWWPVKAKAADGAAKVTDEPEADEAPESKLSTGPIEITNERTIGLEGTAFIGHVRKLHGDAVADKLCDALIDIIPGFRITV